MNTKSVWTNERKEIATWLSGYLAMIKKWVDKILHNEDHDVDKNKIIKLIDEWIQWLEDTKLKIMKMSDVDPEQPTIANPYGDDDWATPEKEGRVPGE